MKWKWKKNCLRLLTVCVMRACGTVQLQGIKQAYKKNILTNMSWLVSNKSIFKPLLTRHWVTCYMCFDSIYFHHLTVIPKHHIVCYRLHRSKAIQLTFASSVLFTSRAHIQTHCTEFPPEHQVYHHHRHHHQWKVTDSVRNFGEWVHTPQCPHLCHYPNVTDSTNYWSRFGDTRNGRWDCWHCAAWLAF